MTRKLNSLLIIILFLLITVVSVADVESSQPEQSENIKLPSPFSRWNACDLAILLYPSYNCKSGEINNKEGGDIRNVALWKEGGKTHLLALFEKYGIGDEREIAGKIVDIALYDIMSGELKVTVSAKGVIYYREYGSSYFDLAPYWLNSKEKAVGVRVEPGISGSYFLNLYLFRIRDKIFQKIFARHMIDTEYYSYEDLSNK